MTLNRLIDTFEAETVKHQFGGDNHIVTHVFKCLSNDQFVMPDTGQVRAVNLCRVKKGAAMLIGISDRLYAVLFFRDFSVTVGEGHTAHTHFGHLDIPQHSCFQR